MTGWVKFENTMPERWNVSPLTDAAFRLWVTAGMASGGRPLLLEDLLAMTPTASLAAVRELRVWELLSKHDGHYELVGPVEWQTCARPAIPRAVRRAVIERDGYTCRLCGGGVQPDDLHLDHIWPFSRGGSHSVENLQVAHARCNIQKGNKVSV